MLEEYDRTLPYRLGFAVVFFLIMGLWDWFKNPENPTRLREYRFLLLSIILWVAYGIVHDHLTATISPEYFLNAKGLARSTQTYRWAVTLLAAKATYGPGALVGALLLIANNPKPDRPQLGYAELTRICIGCMLFAAGTATLLGIASGLLGPWTSLRNLAFAHGAQSAQRPFMLVWGIHFGSYVGAVFGTIWGIRNILRRRQMPAA